MVHVSECMISLSKETRDITGLLQGLSFFWSDLEHSAASTQGVTHSNLVTSEHRNSMTFDNVKRIWVKNLKTKITK